jgi:hypothetical protein
MERFLTKAQLHVVLRGRGHTFWSEEPAEAPLDVWPPPETIITIGLDPDGTLKPAYRQRYFACVRNADEEPLFLHASGFALEEPFATAAVNEPGNNYFAMGPVHWLLARVRRFERVLLWPKGGLRGDDGLGFLTVIGGERTDNAPHVARWLARHAAEPARVGAVLLGLSDLDDCQALWEAANLVGVWSYDFFLSDAAAREVYLLHHHDKVVISIPDARARRELLEDLARQDKLLEDCSGYESEADVEFGW